jgi:PAS domain S-box-containing protein
MSETIFPVAAPPTIDFASAIDAVDRAGSSAARLRAAADALHAWGFGRVMLVLRDANMAPQQVALAGNRDPEQAPDALQPLPGVIWRQRLPLLTRYAVGQWFHLPGSDAWVAREFWASAPAAPAVPGEWGTLDLIVAVISGANGATIGSVMLSDVSPALRPDRERPIEVFALLRHLGGMLSHDVLHAVAQRRAERLQRLQEAGAALARSLDEGEIVRELARQVSRATNADGVMVAAPDLVEGTCRTLARLVGTTERPVGPTRPLLDGVIADVARKGSAVRSEALDSGPARDEQVPWSPLSALDVMGETVTEFGPPGSVLAVPVMSGIRLLAVVAAHATASGRFTAEDEEVVATMASQAATALANARRYAESERERRQTEALADVARAVGESLRPGEVLQLILRHALALLQAQGACIALQTGDWLHIVAGTGAAELFSGVHVPVNASLFGQVTSSGTPFLSNAIAAEPGAYAPLQRLATITNAVLAPLATARGIIGAIGVLNREAPFTDDDVRVLQRLADQVSVAIVNARLFDEVQRATRAWKVAFDSVATGLAVLDDNRRITRCNRCLVELCGRNDVNELLGAHFPTVLLGDSVIAAEDDVIARSSREGAVVRGDVRHTRRGRLFTITAAPHPDGGTMVTVEDVTEGRRMAERFQRVVETALDAIMITDPQRRIVFANPAAHALLGRTSELVGLTSSELVAPESAVAVDRYETLALNGAPQQYECVLIRADGSRRHVEVSSAPLAEVGEITGTVACLRDITDEREGSARADAPYRRLLDEARDAIFTIDLEGRFTSVNHALSDVSGIPREHLIGKRCTAMLDPRDREAGEDAIRRTLQGERLALEVRYPIAAGGIECGMLIASPVYEDGAIVGGFGIVRTISEERGGTE